MALTTIKFNEIVEKAITLADITTAAKYADDMDKMIDACGYSWVTIIADGRSRLGQVVKRNKHFNSDYIPKHFSLWSNGVTRRTQNLCIKEYWCDQIAKFLCDNGIQAYQRSRLD